MAVKIRNRHPLKSKEIRWYQEQTQKHFHQVFFTEKDTIETGRIGEYEVLLINGTIDFMILQDQLFFTLKGLYKHHPTHNYVIVDMGAIPFVTNGADIMAAGIVDADSEINLGDQVWIADETHRKPLAVGKALLDAEHMVQQKSGKAVENIHYIGDKLWELIK